MLNADATVDVPFQNKFNSLRTKRQFLSISSDLSSLYTKQYTNKPINTNFKEFKMTLKG